MLDNHKYLREDAGVSGNKSCTSDYGLDMTTKLYFKPATELAKLIRTRDLTVSQVMTAHLEQIERLNPKVNAICTLVAEDALDQAKKADEALDNGHKPGPLFGLPIAIKDLALTKGIRTTFGSPIYEDFVPDEDALFVERLKNAGAIVIGKTNVPEFGAGSHTYNDVFGTTRNPYNLEKSAGGSSGGAGVALACGMIPIADGSDLGGSVRNPASFNNVVGLRPSPGRIPNYPSEQPWDTLPVLGPMARSVRDVALLLSVMAGPDARDPISLPNDRSNFQMSPDRDFKDIRIAWSPDLGMFPVENAVTDVIEKGLPRFSDLGCIIEQAHPDFSGADEIFQVLRAQAFAYGGAKDLAEHREQMKDTVIWNIEKGLALTALEISQAQAKRAALYQRVRNFFERYDYLLLPVSQVVPFPIEVEWVKEINGVEMQTYVDWMMSCSFITLTGHPAMSVPCGFTPDGLPLGIQIVGRHRGEFELLQLAYAFEQLTRYGAIKPKITL
jgi:amidase